MVKLLIEGDLSAAGQSWFEVEQMHRRCRVAFTSFRSNDTVTAYVVEARSANHSPYISCLASPDQLRHYFVGTDALNALEVMLGVSLADDQKKGLRNKFERHGSVTIRRDHDQDDLFKLIERNNDIKPRNLHKGVRIYNWERLADFLTDLASKVPAELLPATLPCTLQTSAPMSQYELPQGYAATASPMQYDQYPLTPTSQQTPYMHSSPGVYEPPDAYNMHEYTTTPSYQLAAGYGSPVFASQYTMAPPSTLIDPITSQPAAYQISYAPQHIQGSPWDQHGMRYTQ